MGYLDNLMMYSRRGLEEFSKDMLGYTKASVQELAFDYWNGFLLGIGYYYFKKSEKELGNVFVEGLEKIGSREEPRDFVEEIIKTSRDELLDL